MRQSVRRMVDRRPPYTLISFNAKLVSSNRDDALREFVVIYNVEDNKFTVHEKVIPNSGFRGGRFLQPTTGENPETGAPYEPDQVTIGSVITIATWKFRLISACEGTLKMMEARSDLFARSDLTGVFAQLATQLKGRQGDLKNEFVRRDKAKRGRLRNAEVKDILDDFQVTLGGQEWITLQRRFQFADSDTFLYNDFLAFLT
jgi:hypothetical protein